jgi:Xaa-Pro aminopeptidase
MEIDFSLRRLGSERNAFETIVASGIRSSLPHGTPSDRVICSGDFVTMDFGAVFGGYCSDITRTLIMERPDTRQKDIYKLVKQAQETAIKNIQPGMIAADIDRIAREIIASEGYGEAFGHGLGHGVGLDIHEEPRFSPRDKTILEPGMVITVEPGIYLQGWGGVRIEDMIVVTARGCEVLTNSPKSIQDMIVTH